MISGQLKCRGSRSYFDITHAIESLFLKQPDCFWFKNGGRVEVGQKFMVTASENTF